MVPIALLLRLLPIAEAVDVRVLVKPSGAAELLVRQHVNATGWCLWASDSSPFVQDAGHRLLSHSQPRLPDITSLVRSFMLDPLPSTQVFL
jgi:hypothetical protein